MGPGVSVQAKVTRNGFAAYNRPGNRSDLTCCGDEIRGGLIVKDMTSGEGVEEIVETDFPHALVV